MAKASTKSEDLASRYRLEDVSAFAAAQLKLREIQATLAELQGRVREIQQRLGSMPDGKQAVSYAARAVLAGEVPDPSQIETMMTDARSLAKQLEIYKEAARLQQEVIERERGQASKTLCKDAFPVHRELVRRILDASDQLQEACRQEEAFRDGLKARGVLVGPPMLDYPARFPQARNELEYYALAVREAGYLD